MTKFNLTLDIEIESHDEETLEDGIYNGTFTSEILEKVNIKKIS